MAEVRRHPPLSTAHAPPQIQAVLIGILFCLSGIPALIYQMAWQRILAFHSGVGAYSVAMIVAGYMAGLGIGNHLGGLLSRRLSALASLLAFAGIELSVGLFAALSCSLYYDLLYIQGAWLRETAWRAGLCHFLALSIPTCLMGMTLPLLVRSMVRGAGTASRTIGSLYGINVLGAAIGAFITPWVLIRHLGIDGAILFGVGCNLLVGIGALVIGYTLVGLPSAMDQVGGAPPERIEPSDAVVHRPFGLWIALYSLSGFYAIALEIIWFRLVDVCVKSTAFTFGSVLAIYLLGLAIGSLVGTRWLGRVNDPLRVFLVCQCLVLIYAGVAVELLVLLPADSWGYRWMFDYWGSYDGLDPARGDLAAVLTLYGGLPALLYGIPTLLMGLTFTLLQRAVHDQRRTSGYKVGVLQASNIVGCVAGSLLVGLLFLATLGTADALRALIASGCLFAVLGCWCTRSGSPFASSDFASLGLALLVLAAVMPDRECLWLRLHGRRGGPALFEEDETGVVAMTPEIGGRWRMSVNGNGQSWLPFGGVHSVLGALPATLHPSPKRVAVVGLGSGDTAWAAACRPEIERVVVFEICAPELKLLRRLNAVQHLSALERFLNDRRIAFVEADGRNAISAGHETYDLIEADAIRPDGAYSGNLYSLEFFRLCAAKLNPGGLMCTWSPTGRVHATFRRAFAHVLELEGGGILIGSNEPIEFDPVAWRERLHSVAVVDYLGEAIVSECSSMLATAGLLPTFPASTGRVNFDLKPRDEYQSP